ncbi:MAG: hypothetical protein AAGC65_16540 [Mucilaginibacter sp.]|uniref:hypothetical protein n=1 Tax=Mucilaginibacter sp. TaxID=1882438 RepID=UPI0031AD34AD
MNKTIKFNAAIRGLDILNSKVKVFEANNPTFEKTYHESTTSFSACRLSLFNAITADS